MRFRDKRDCAACPKP
jgi:Phage integrase family